MFYDRQGDSYILRFEEGEVFPDRFLEFLSANSIAAGAFTGIGAMKKFEIAYFDATRKQYHDREYEEQVEVLALVGNVAQMDGAPLVHVHVTLGRRNFSVLGGHLRSGVVCPTLEVALSVFPEPIKRKIDPAFGLPGLDLTNRL
jgi:predicted DNA-binding protein with PD1-like motif